MDRHCKGEQARQRKGDHSTIDRYWKGKRRMAEGSERLAQARDEVGHFWQVHYCRDGNLLSKGVGEASDNCQRGSEVEASLCS